MIETYLFLVVATGAVLISLLALFVFRMNKLVSLKRHRSNAEGLVDLLNYASVVDDGVIVNKNGSFMAAFLYRGSDEASSTDEQREMVSYRMNQALAQLGGGWVLHVDASRSEAPAYMNSGLSSFPDLVTAAIEDERREFFERMGTVYEGWFIATFTYYPPMLSTAKFVELMFDDDRQTVTKGARSTQLIQSFKAQIDRIQGLLSAGLTLERLGSEKVVNEDGTAATHDNFLRFLQYCVTGNNHPVVLPDTPVYLDSLIGNQELWGGVVPRIGRKFVQVVSIDGLPSESTPGLLSSLGELPISYRWSTRFIFLDGHEAEALLHKLQKKWKQRVRGFMDQLLNRNGNIDEDAIAMVADASGALADVKAGLVRPGFYTSVVVLMSEDRDSLDDAARFVEASIMSRGFGARIETINTMDAFFGSLPGHAVENVRRPLIHSYNVAHLLPTSSIWTGENVAPSPLYPAGAPPLMQCLTTGHAAFRLNLHVRDLGHTTIFGPTRSGKSTLLGLIAAQARRYPGMTVACFEKGGSMFALCEATGGNHVSVAAEASSGYAPLAKLDTRSDRAWAMDWIDTLLALNGVQTTPSQRTEIGNAIVSMNDSQSRTLTDFCASVQDMAIREALVPYTLEGTHGHLLDALIDGLELSNFNVFEIGELMGMGDKYALPVLLYLFRRVEQSLKGQPALIILDEAWMMLGHPAFRARIRDWLKTLAKANCAVVLATQNLSDAKNSGIVDVIVESTATKIFLPNAFAANEEVADLYRTMGLNNTQLGMLTTAMPKQDYYVVSELGNRMCQLALGPRALAFAAVSDPESIATIRALKTRLGPDWIYEWATLRGADLPKASIQRELAA